MVALVGGLLAIKTSVTFSLAPLFGLNRAESIRTALTLSQGGEFAFVLLSLANSLNVLPTDLNKLLISVVGGFFRPPQKMLPLFHKRKGGKLSLSPLIL